MTTKNDNGKLEIDLLYVSTKRPIRLTFEGKRKYRAVRRDSISDEPCEYAWKDTPDEALAELAEFLEAGIATKLPLSIWIEEGYPVEFADQQAEG